MPGRAVRLRDGRVPRIGWAPVEPGGEAFYFAHSYAAETPATTARSEGIAAVVEADGFVGVQFHPEKSGAAGARFLERCLSRLIPCLDVAGGRVVKGVQFEGCATSATRSSSAPRTPTRAPTSSSSST